MNNILERFKELQIDMDYTKSSLFNAADNHYSTFLWIRRIIRFASFVLLLLLAINEKLCSAIGIGQHWIIIVAVVVNIINWLISEMSQSMEELNQKNQEYRKYANEINRLLKESKIVVAIYNEYNESKKQCQEFQDLNEYLISELKIYTEKYNIISEKMPHIPECAYKKTRKNFNSGTNIYTKKERDNV